MADIGRRGRALIGRVFLAGCALLLSPPSLMAQTRSFGSDAYIADFDSLWADVQLNYAYWHRVQTDWQEVRRIYRPQVSRVRSTREFVQLLERTLAELYDPHAHLLVNTKESPRLIPTDADLWAEWRQQRALVTSVRQGSAGGAAGVQAGDEVITIDGRPVSDVVAEWLPRAHFGGDPHASNWALVAALSGRRHEEVRLTLRRGARVHEAVFHPAVERAAAPASSRWLTGRVLYVRVNNSLGDTALIHAWDAVIDSLARARGLILDLRDTPSGGNSLVARGLMSRVICEVRPYQQHELVAEARISGVRRLWVEYVAPRGATTYRGPLAVLVGRWTGSMGEGIAIGLDGMRRASIFGGPMAGLLGGTYTRTLPGTGIRYNLPMERLSHIDGRPRESFVPRDLAGSLRGPEEDALAESAARMLLRSNASRSRPQLRPCT